MGDRLLGPAFGQMRGERRGCVQEVWDPRGAIPPWPIHQFREGVKDSGPAQNTRYAESDLA